MLLHKKELLRKKLYKVNKDYRHSISRYKDENYELSDDIVTIKYIKYYKVKDIYQKYKWYSDICNILWYLNIEYESYDKISWNQSYYRNRDGQKIINTTKKLGLYSIFKEYFEIVFVNMSKHLNLYHYFDYNELLEVYTPNNKLLRLLEIYIEDKTLYVAYYTDTYKKYMSNKKHTDDMYYNKSCLYTCKRNSWDREDIVIRLNLKYTSRKRVRSMLKNYVED